MDDGAGFLASRFNHEEKRKKRMGIVPWKPGPGALLPELRNNERVPLSMVPWSSMP
jgi:hypothetical protein